MPVILDLFCGEGGAGEGYARAGWDVVGVDLEPAMAKRYGHPFFAGDALGFLEDWWLYFDAIHASPPCHAYSVTAHSVPEATREGYPRLIEPVREFLRGSGKPYIIENVVGAPLLDPVLLCGSMFGLEADDDGGRVRLERHRLFESNMELSAPSPCRHDKSIKVAGVYGAGPSTRTGGRGGYTPRVGVKAELMGIDWMTVSGMAEAIPPAYTEHLGRQLLEQL